MPLLSRTLISRHIETVGKRRDRPTDREGVHPDWATKAHFRPGLFESCANPSCRSGWLHLWRSRSVPVFEDGWTCSPECNAARILSAVRRELDGRDDSQVVHHHRVPLGLLMLEQGWITRIQLREAVEAQTSAGVGRPGEWLVEHGAVEESMVTRALGLQWSCAVLTMLSHRSQEFTAVMPQLFVDAFGALPVRLAAGKLLYLGFEEGLDPALALAVERMLKLHVECGIVQGSHFRAAHARMLDAKSPSLELVEAVSDVAASHALSRSVEKARPVESRLVRVRDHLWLRMWLSHQNGPLPENNSVRDVVCSVGSFQIPSGLLVKRSVLKNLAQWPMNNLAGESQR